jgi:hypothetical protein
MRRDRPVRIHGLMCVHDEADVLDEVLDHLLPMVESLHILDTGSRDGCWDIVRTRQRRDARVETVERSGVPFCNGHRGVLFELARRRFRAGDWVARFDPDEFYVPGLLPPDDAGHAADLHEFLATRVRPWEGRVLARMFEFVITAGEAAGLAAGRGGGGASIREARRWYVTDPVPEPRLFRFRRGMRWGPGHANPFSPGLVAAERVAVAHYRWRSLDQMKVRHANRLAAAGVTHHGTHWSVPSWEEWVYADSDARLRRFEPGAAGRLDGPRPESPERGGWRGGLRSALYRSGVVHLTDRLRRGWGRDQIRAVLTP